MRKPTPACSAGRVTSGNGLTITYTSYNKTATIKRGTTEISFAHDTEHNRYSQLGPSGETLYLSGGGGSRSARRASAAARCGGPTTSSSAAG
jgi:hypothetical protein